MQRRLLQASSSMFWPVPTVSNELASCHTCIASMCIVTKRLSVLASMPDSDDAIRMPLRFILLATAAELFTACLVLVCEDVQGPAVVREASHVTDVVLQMRDSAASGAHVRVQSTCMAGR